jgi:hypothetical protein
MRHKGTQQAREQVGYGGTFRELRTTLGFFSNMKTEDASLPKRPQVSTRKYGITCQQMANFSRHRENV